MLCLQISHWHGHDADRRTGISTPLSVLMRAEDSYLSKKVLVDDLRGLVDQYVNPWKTTDLGKWLCDIKENQPFTRSEAADLDRALEYKRIQNTALLDAYKGCYQNNNMLSYALHQSGLPNDDESIYQLLNSIREEVITEYLLQEGLFSLDYSVNESENSADERKTKKLLKEAGVSKNSIRQFALGLASAITGIQLSSLAHSSDTIHTILTNATSSSYSPFDSTIAGLLLIAGAVKDSDKNVALTLALRGDPGWHQLDLLEFHAVVPGSPVMSEEERSSYEINSIRRVPVIRHSGNSWSPQINSYTALYKEENSAAPFFDRKWRYIFTYRLSRETNKPQTELHPEVIHFLAASGAHFNIAERWAKLDQFVFMNANINAFDRNQNSTALHKAVASGQLDVVDKLLTAGANVNVTNKLGNTPLHGAVIMSSSSIADRLLAAGANINAVNKDGNTPLHIALRKKNISLVETLLAAKADINVANNEGDTPLHIAAFMSLDSIVDKLLDAGAHTNTTNTSGDTPLHNAASCPSADSIVDKLLAAGANINAANNEHNTPLHIVVRTSLFSKLVLHTQLQCLFLLSALQLLISY